jgi:hypothetical protein
MVLPYLSMAPRGHHPSQNVEVTKNIDLRKVILFLDGIKQEED